jgi:hypothetical protein
VEHLVAGITQMAVPLCWTRSPREHDDKRIRPAGSQHLEDLLEDE